MESVNLPDKEYIAFCGLYCGECSRFRSGRCPGCRKNGKATWCKIRSCCKDNAFHTCAECGTDVHECKKYNNFISKIFALLFKSDRAACIRRIHDAGEDVFAKEMSERNAMTIKKRKEP